MLIIFSFRHIKGEARVMKEKMIFDYRIQKNGQQVQNSETFQSLEAIQAFFD